MTGKETDMLQKPTDEMEEALKEVRPGQIDSYLKTNSQFMVDEKRAFYFYMKDVLKRKGIMHKDLYARMNVSEKYGGQILTMEKHTPNRDLIISFCIAGHFDWNETGRALKLYGFNELYAKDPRDAVIMVALNNRIYDFEAIDEMLIQKGFDRISREYTE